MELLYKYRNGNYNVYFFDDGTKVRQTTDDTWKPAFAENIDIKLTNKCTGTNCTYCHEGSGPNGENGDILNLKFFDTLHEGQEVALGGGNIFEHPDLLTLLEKLKNKHIICNITVNQFHFFKYLDLIKTLIKDKLVYGIGVSLVYPTDKLLEILKEPIFKNVVIHTINGILTKEQIEKLKDKNLKILILGYKCLRRGEEYYEEDKESIEENQKWLKDNIMSLMGHFNVISFDNLALEQLDMKSRMSEATWNKLYMGDDGTSTFYIDCVNKQFATSSIQALNKRYDLLDNVDDMFKIIQEEK